MPKGALFTRDDVVAWLVLLTRYLVSMTFAMYPGRRSPPVDDQP